MVTVTALDAALANYRAALERLASIHQCLSTWPSDPAGPDYQGTRCQLLGGHLERDGTQHRHRVIGTQTTLEWE